MKIPDKFEALWTDFLEGELDQAGMNLLREMLDDDSGLQKHAGDLYETHRLLGAMHTAHQGEVEEFVANFQVKLTESDQDFVDKVDAQLPLESLVKPTFNPWMAIAALLMLLLVTFVLMKSKPSPDHGLALHQPEHVATLILTDQCEWKGSHPIEGGRLQAGSLTLVKGTAVLRFDGGAELVIKSPSQIDLESAGSARLVQGEVLVRAPEQAAGFTLMTETSEIVDLGTEFAVKVEQTGSTELQVLDGAVEYRNTGTTRLDSKRLNAGRAILLKTTGEEMPLQLFQKFRFDDYVQAASPIASNSSLIAFEDFNYPAGDHSNDQLNGGVGWSGAWRLRKEAERMKPGVDITRWISIRDWSLPFGRFIKQNSAAIVFPEGFHVRMRPMASPIDMSQDRVVYISMLTHIPKPKTRDAAKQESAIRLTLRSTDDYWGDALSFGLHRSMRPQVQVGRGVGFRSLQSVEEGQSVLFVAKITASQFPQDEVSFHVFSLKETLPVIEPGDWHVTTRQFRNDAKLDLLLLTSQGPEPRLVDELRIGATWRSVVPVQSTLVAR